MALGRSARFAFCFLSTLRHSPETIGKKKKEKNNFAETKVHGVTSIFEIRRRDLLGDLHLNKALTRL